MSVVLVAFAAPAEAQVIPRQVKFDSSWRAGFLFGSQLVLHGDFEKGAVGATEAHLARLRQQFDPRLAVLSGMFEVSPLLRISGRMAGSVSALEGDMTVRHATVDRAQPSVWDVTPDFKQWEAAGLYHLWSGPAYRFSIVGGFRQQFWKYLGDPAGNQPNGSSLRDEFRSNIPFIALQTSVYYPWWKARFEILGSPFMSTEVLTRVNDLGYPVEFVGTANQGGLIELEFEGTGTLTPRMRLGLFARYAYQELYGESTRWAGDNRDTQKLFVEESFATVGVNFTFVF